MSDDLYTPDAESAADPYRNFRFRLKMGGRYVAAVSKVGGLKHSTQVVSHRGGGDPLAPRHLPGQTEYEAITLERGVTCDVAFAQWANKVWDYHSSMVSDAQGARDLTVSLADFRRDLVLDVYNEAGQKVLAFRIYRCWPSEFTALPELDANGNAVAIQFLRLENEGWERDPSVGKVG